MSSAAPGWYPDPQQRDFERYFDGTRWTDRSRPQWIVDAGGPAPSGWTGFAVLVGVVVGGVALATFLHGQGLTGSGADSYARYTCDDLAEEAVRISDESGSLFGTLLKVRGVTLTDDHRTSYTRPTGTDDALILGCRGAGVWSNGADLDVELSLTIDSDGDVWVGDEPVG